MLLEVRRQLVIRAHELADAWQLEQAFGKLGDRLMKTGDFLACLLHLHHHLLGLLALRVGFSGEISERRIAIHRGCASARLLCHEPPNLLLHGVVLLTKLVVLFLDTKVMLDLLGLVVVPGLHLLRPHALELLLKALFLIGKGLQRQHQLLDFILALLEHLFLLAHVAVEAFTLTTALLLVAP